MDGRLKPTSTMSPRRSTVIVTAAPSGTSVSVVDGCGCGSADGAWPCTCAVAATARSAVPLSSARRPTLFGDVSCMVSSKDSLPLQHPQTDQAEEDAACADQGDRFAEDQRAQREQQHGD